jgi:hypothetical protein
MKKSKQSPVLTRPAEYRELMQTVLDKYGAVIKGNELLGALGYSSPAHCLLPLNAEPVPFEFARTLIKGIAISQRTIWQFL